MSTDKHSLDPNIEDQDQNDKNPIPNSICQPWFIT